MPFLQLPMTHMVTAGFKTALTIETTEKNPLVYIVWWTDTHNVGKFISTLIWQKFKRQLKGSVKEPNMFHNYETEKITLKAKTRSSADADNRLDAFSGQSRSTNMVPFHM